MKQLSKLLYSSVVMVGILLVYFLGNLLIGVTNVQQKPQVTNTVVNAPAKSGNVPADTARIQSPSEKANVSSSPAVGVGNSTSVVTESSSSVVVDSAITETSTQGVSEKPVERGVGLRERGSTEYGSEVYEAEGVISNITQTSDNKGNYISVGSILMGGSEVPFALTVSKQLVKGTVVFVQYVHATDGSSIKIVGIR